MREKLEGMDGDTFKENLKTRELKREIKKLLFDIGNHLEAENKLTDLKSKVHRCIFDAFL